MVGKTLGSAPATDREIVISRVFDAPRTLVFKAWTDPELVIQWWGPKGYTGLACEMDLRPGGTFWFEMRGPDGNVCPCRGTIRELVEPERMVFVGDPGHMHACGGGLPPEGIVTVTFAERNGKTVLTIHTRLPSRAQREATIAAGFQPGWETCLDRLATHLPKVA